MKTPKRVLRWERRMFADVGIHQPTNAARILMRQLWNLYQRTQALPPGGEEYSKAVQTYGRTFDRLRAMRRR